MLKNIDKKLKELIEGSFNRPHIVLILTVLSIIILSFGFKGFKLSLAIDELVNPSYQTSKSYFNLKDKFESGADLLLLRVASDSFQLSTICDHRHFFQAQALKQENIWALYSPFSLRSSLVIGKNGSNFNSLIFKPLVNINCSEKYLRHSSSVDFKYIKSSPWSGIIANSEGSSFLTKVNFEQMGERNFYGKVIPSIVDKVIQEFEEVKSSKDSENFWLGQAVYQYWVSKGIKFHNTLNIALILLVSLFLRMFFGTWKSSLFFFTSLLVSIIFIYMLISYTSTPIDVLNNSLFLLLTISSLGDYVFISHNCLNSTDHWIDSFKSLALPSFFTSLTTFIGFISLCSSDLDIVKRFGFWAAMSGVIEWISLFLILPAILKTIQKNKKWVDNQKIYGKKLLKQLESIRIPKVLVYSLLILYITSLMTPYGLVVNDNPNKLFPDNHSFRKAIGALKDNFSYEGKLSLVFNDNEQIEFNKRIINEVRKYKSVIKVEDPYSMVEYLTKRLDESESDIVKRSLNNSISYKRLVSEDQVRAVLYLDKTNLKDINDFRYYVNNKLCLNGECELTGALVAYADFSQLVPATLINSLFISLILVFIVLLVLSKNQKIGEIVILLISSFWGVALILTVLVFGKVELNFVTCIVVAILVGMTGDNAIHYLLADGTINHGVKVRSGASVMTTLIMSSCCLIFFFYTFRPPQVFGALLFVGLWGSLLGDLWILNSLIDIKKTNNK